MKFKAIAGAATVLGLSGMATYHQVKETVGEYQGRVAEACATGDFQEYRWEIDSAALEGDFYPINEAAAFIAGIELRETCYAAAETETENATDELRGTLGDDKEGDRPSGISM